MKPSSMIHMSQKKKKWRHEMIEKDSWCHLLDPTACTHAHKVHTHTIVDIKSLRLLDFLIYWIHFMLVYMFACLLHIFMCGNTCWAQTWWWVPVLIVLDFIYWALLVDIWPLTEPGVLCSACAGDSPNSASRMLIFKGPVHSPGFICVMGKRTLVCILMWQLFYPLNYFSSPYINF